MDSFSFQGKVFAQLQKLQLHTSDTPLRPLPPRRTANKCTEIPRTPIAQIAAAPARPRPSCVPARRCGKCHRRSDRGPRPPAPSRPAPAPPPPRPARRPARATLAECAHRCDCRSARRRSSETSASSCCTERLGMHLPQPAMAGLFAPVTPVETEHATTVELPMEPRTACRYQRSTRSASS